jgi:predicted Zn-dependent protease
LTERIAAQPPPAAPANKAAEEAGKKKPAVSEAIRQQQKKSLIAARLKALPFWNDLRSHFSASRHVPEAIYHVGVLYNDGEKPNEALAAFNELIVKYPTSPWTGEAQVRLIDVKLERQFDLPGARKLVETAVDWYEHLDHAKGLAGQDRTDGRPIRWPALVPGGGL